MRGLAYLGTGLKYPTQIVNGKAVIAKSDNLIQQSIYIILSTPIGTRFMLPEFGSRVSELLFETNDTILYSMLRLFISDALEKWEKRIRFKDVQFEQNNDVLMCTIKYKILASNEIDSYIYPFYKKIIH